MLSHPRDYNLRGGRASRAGFGALAETIFCTGKFHESGRLRQHARGRALPARCGHAPLGRVALQKLRNAGPKKGLPFEPGDAKGSAMQC